jgi:hypothetical protein
MKSFSTFWISVFLFAFQLLAQKNINRNFTGNRSGKINGAFGFETGAYF